MPTFVLSHHLAIVMALCSLTLLIAVIVNSFLRSFIKIPAKLDTRRGRTYVSIVRNAITAVISIITLHILFVILGINIAPLLASAGIIGIVIGIGARSIFEDVIAGIFLISQSKIAVGDYLDFGNGIEGTVESIGLKNLTLISNTGALTIIPNGQIKQVTNNSYGRAQVIIDIPVKVGQPIDTVLSAFETVLETFKEDKKYPILSGSKVLGIQKIDVHNAYIISVLIISHRNLRGEVDPEFRYRLVKHFEKKKLQFA